MGCRVDDEAKGPSEGLAERVQGEAEVAKACPFNR